MTITPRPPVAGVRPVPASWARIELRSAHPRCHRTRPPTRAGDPGAEAAISTADAREDGGHVIVTVDNDAAPAPSPAAKPSRSNLSIVVGGNMPRSNVATELNPAQPVTLPDRPTIGGSRPADDPTPSPYTGGVDVAVTVPGHIDMELVLPSGSVTTRGPLEEVTVVGEDTVVVIERATAVEVINRVGTITASEAGVLKARGEFGAIRVGTVTRCLDVTTVHGDVVVDRAQTAEVTAHTDHGDITITDVPEVTIPARNLGSTFGRVRVAPERTS